MRKRSAILLLLPAFVGVLIFTFYPLIQIIIPTLNQSSDYGKLYLEFLKSSYNQTVIFRTLAIALFTTLVVLVLGLPLAIWIARQDEKVRKLLSVIILFPMLTNAVIRNFAWIIILGKNGVFNDLLLKLHLISAPITILYTNAAIVIGSAYLFLPIMVTSLVGSITELNIETEEAAAVLGAGAMTNLFKVIIPQLTTGILTGCILVFAGTMTAYTTPQLLGGNRHLVMATLIYQQAMTLGDWTNASVVAIILIILSVVIMFAINKLMKKLDRRKVNA
ncbi:ABC transporter permease [Liquorilactobacillus cacaonum]|uniref:ABC transmembrane type-1 domain-containing protein n=1 Tax=Liquorilactobacillus cacaonum DSM 21116 TaxID=1423729 RepID=A0A0R2CJX0_9LACO|nr:ABC transporter permease [Liquorilactobacillus cacaonum]KRM91951.1 hypothetical protein FC80_GL000131 [Liquorilactobacillus cacaonum DSM 21116]